MSSGNTCTTTTRPGSPITLIGRHGTAYACPDVPAVDRHLQALHDRIARPRPGAGQLVTHARDDIDLLLDRRLRLEHEQRLEQAQRAAPARSARSARSA